MSAQERGLIQDLFQAPWLTRDLEQRALGLAASTLVPEHYQEVSDRRVAHVDKTLAAVHERLTKEINFQTHRFQKLTDDKAAGKDVRLNLENTRRGLEDLQDRLENRKRDLLAQRHVASSTPVVLSGALVIPEGLLKQRRGEMPEGGSTFSADAAARARIEQIGMMAVTLAEQAKGCTVVDVSRDKCGWDITSYPPVVNGKQPDPRHIEVKGRAKGSTTITVTRNEILYALNQADKFLLAIVLVGDNEKVDGPHYISAPFSGEPDWAVSSINFDLNSLMERENHEIK